MTLADVERYLRRALRDWSGRRGFALVAGVEGRRAGFVLVEVLGDRTHYRRPVLEGEVQELHVVPRFRRRGVATALMNATEAELVRRGCRTVRLTTWAGEAFALARGLYEGRGYRPFTVQLRKRLR
jgi:ribosomal protein S18 acetylase RimI-like enzyme